MPPTHDPPLYGLVLIGGNSSRMGCDKASLQYHGQPEWKRIFQILESHTKKTFLSLNAEQANATEFSEILHIVDRWVSIGPMNGIASAMHEHPEAAWLIVACDMPNLDQHTITRLVNARKSERDATLYVDADDRLEPLCAIYEPAIADQLSDSIANDQFSLHRCLELSQVERVSLIDTSALTNLNTPEESDNYRQQGVHCPSRKENP